MYFSKVVELACGELVTNRATPLSFHINGLGNQMVKVLLKIRVEIIIIDRYEYFHVLTMHSFFSPFLFRCNDNE